MGALALLLVTLSLILGLVLSRPAHAHAPQAGDQVMGLAGVLHHWSFEPWVLALLALSAVLYAVGVHRLWRHAGGQRGISRAQAAAFAGGWLALVAALVSPLDALGERLFSAHMVQHELLMIVAAPLLVLGRPLAAWAWAIPAAPLRVIGSAFRSSAWSGPWRLITDPLAAWALHALALWVWHVPAFFEAALEHTGWHVLQHASFLVTALLFWWAVIGGDTRSRKSAGLATFYLFTTMLHTGALGALLTLASTPWYPAYAATASAMGLAPLEDQQLGGLVMWVPGGVAYLAAGLAAVTRLLASPEHPATATPPAPTRSAAR
jgi:putative membrane protein